ncbi:MAG: hypothetical protein DDT19_02947 [Syntrophomonadaceae bacterium]|nr:hypothetical protein [Bacillota bacterium]
MYKIAFNLLLLRRHPMADFNFPVWQSAVFVTILGVIAGLDPAIGISNPLARVLFGLVLIWFFSFLGRSLWAGG